MERRYVCLCGEENETKRGAGGGVAVRMWCLIESECGGDSETTRWKVHALKSHLYIIHNLHVNGLKVGLRMGKEMHEECHATASTVFSRPANGKT